MMSQENDDKAFRELLRHGTGFLQQGKYQDALQFLQKAYDLRPDDIDASLNLSGAYILNKKFSKAVPLLEALSEQLPDNAMIWTNLGAAYLGNPVLSDEPMQDRAIAAFEQALALDSEAPSVAYNIGLIYYLYKKDKVAAKPWFERAVASYPRDLDAQSYLDKIAAEEE
ncbi:MAG TPA: tetratricopeptide repeat protein [Anaerolineae bacterium]|nr:tetratricopeptide repeat protein [Anaerolineae bacterium]